MEKEYKDITLDLKDLFCTLLLSLKKALIGGMAFSVLFFGYSCIKSNFSFAQSSYAGNTLSENEKLKIMSLFDKYKSQSDYIEKLQHRCFTLMNLSDYEFTQKIALYSIASDTEVMEDLFNDLFLTQDVLMRINAIISDDVNGLELYDLIHIRFNDKEKIITEYNPSSVFNGADNSNISRNHFFTVSIIAQNDEKCDLIQEILDAHFQKQLSNIQKYYPNSSLVLLGENYNLNYDTWTDSQIQNILFQLNNVETEFDNFKNEHIKGLNEEQLAYFNTLLVYDGDIPQDSVSDSTSSFSLIAFLLSFLFGVLCVFTYILAKYFAGDSIKSAIEIPDSYGIPVLNTISIISKHPYLIEKIVKKVKRLEDKKESDKINLIANDICIIIDKEHLNSLYFACISDSDEERLYSDYIKAAIIEKCPDFSCSTGYPFEVTGLNNLYKSMNVVLVIQTKKAYRKKISELLTVCKRYEINVLGAITIETV